MKNIAIPENVYDVVIIGGGPAGFTAGLYAARARMKTLIIESLSVMGQATMTDEIENYPGIEKTGGFDLVNKMKDQALSFGAETLSLTVENIRVVEKGETKLWVVNCGTKEIEALSIIVATGASPRKLNAPGEEEFTGRGVSYCATCDAAFFKEKDVVVVGGGNAAIEEAIFLTKFVRKITVVHRRDRLRASKVVQERAFANKKMEFVWDSVVEEIAGSGKVERVRIKNVKTEEDSELVCDGVFVFTGWIPNTAFIEDLIELGEKKHVITDENMATNKPGIFAGGDCRQRPLNQVITACSDGAIAAQSAQHYVETLKGTAYE